MKNRIRKKIEERAHSGACKKAESPNPKVAKKNTDKMCNKPERYSSVNA
jgi:hypothetical protein